MHTYSLCVSNKKTSSSCREGSQSAADRKKADEKKAKIHMSARIVIGIQKAAAGPLSNISHQRAPHRRCQSLPELSEDDSRALRRDPGMSNTNHRETRHEIPALSSQIGLLNF